jgi:hypothetical protein
MWLAFVLHLLCVDGVGSSRCSCTTRHFTHQFPSAAMGRPWFCEAGSVVCMGYTRAGRQRGPDAKRYGARPQPGIRFAALLRRAVLTLRMTRITRSMRQRSSPKFAAAGDASALQVATHLATSSRASYTYHTAAVFATTSANDAWHRLRKLSVPRMLFSIVRGGSRSAHRHTGNEVSETVSLLAHIAATRNSSEQFDQEVAVTGCLLARVNGNRKLISWRQSKIDQLGFIGRRP